MKALVTGGSGFIGGHIVDRLLADGHQVRCLVRDAGRAQRLAALGVELVRGDVIIPESLATACAGVDCVFHAAARVSDWGPWREFEAATVRGTENMLRAALAAGVPRFVHISSISVYDPRVYRRGQPRVREESPLAQPHARLDNYTRAKVLAERLVFAHRRDFDEVAIPVRARGARARAAQLAVSVVRPATVYGPRDFTIVPRLVKFLKSPLAGWLGRGDPAPGLIYVTDVADLCVAAATSEAAIGRAYNAAPAEGEDITLRQFITAICAALELPIPQRTYPRWLVAALAFLLETAARLARRKDPPLLTRAGLRLLGRDKRFDISRAQRDLGWRPRVGLAQGVAETAAWLKQQGLV